MAPSSAGPGRPQRHESRDGSNPIGGNSSSTERWNVVPRGTMDEVSSYVRLDLLSVLTARPTERLFHLVFEPHNGRALVPIPKRSASPRATSTPQWWIVWKRLTLIGRLEKWTSERTCFEVLLCANSGSHFSLFDDLVVRARVDVAPRPLSARNCGASFRSPRLRASPAIIWGTPVWVALRKPPTTSIQTGTGPGRGVWP
jgi:hypothetical protein